LSTPDYGSIRPVRTRRTRRRPCSRRQGAAAQARRNRASRLISMCTALFGRDHQPERQPRRLGLPVAVGDVPVLRVEAVVAGLVRVLVIWVAPPLRRGLVLGPTRAPSQAPPGRTQSASRRFTVSRGRPTWSVGNEARRVGSRRGPAPGLWCFVFSTASSPTARRSRHENRCASSSSMAALQRQVAG